MSVQPYNDDGAIQPVPAAVITDYAEIDAVLMGAPPAAQFRDIGALVTGKIQRVILRQATDFGTKELKWWPDGAPVLEPVITLDTAEGPLSLYAGSRGMRDALKEACRAAGIGLRPGGRLAVRYTGDGEPYKGGANRPKVYEAAYEPPAGLPVNSGPTIAQRLEADKASRVTQLVQQQEPPF